MGICFVAVPEEVALVLGWKTFSMSNCYAPYFYQRAMCMQCTFNINFVLGVLFFLQLQSEDHLQPRVHLKKKKFLLYLFNLIL